MIRFFAFAGALLIASPAMASDQGDVMATVHAFVAAIDKGDMTAAAATHTDAPAIIDEFPPHHWSSLASWAADFGKDSAAHGITEPLLTLHTAHRITISGETAYVVVPTDYSFKRDGKKRVEHATMTYALTHTASGWLIAGWAFSW